MFLVSGQPQQQTKCKRVTCRFISLQLVANVADCDGNDTKKAIDVANNAFQLWKSTSCRERSQLLKDLYECMMSNQKDLATIMAIESGKLYPEVKYQYTITTLPTKMIVKQFKVLLVC